MSFTKSIKSFWKNYTNFKGRASRSEYWFISLFLFLTNLAAAMIDLAIMEGDLDRFIANGGGGIVGLVWILVTLLPALAVLVRRLHDTGNRRVGAHRFCTIYWCNRVTGFHSQRLSARIQQLWSLAAAT